MLVHGASLATEPPAESFAARGFDRARAFQNRVGEWVHHGEAPVAVLRAPTGGGKTATFHELIEKHDLTLLVYPTNALLRQQHDRFADDVDVAVLNGATLDGHGRARTDNLLTYVDRWGTDHEVVITNPDILQAVIQDMYAGANAMEFFDRFDAVVYDEFHFYDDFAASGLLLQIKIVTERIPGAQVLLASATPNESFVEFVANRLGIDVREISAEYTRNGSAASDRFREDVELVRRDDRRIVNQREAVAEELRELIDEADNLCEPRVALVFNSAKDSNDFHQYLHDHHPIVFEQTAKDNGFETNDARVDLDAESYYVLNTTSKGEVGLDNDIVTLYMEKPYGSEASAFLQRFGRAGRQSEAVVYTFGLGQGPWTEDAEVSFPTFVEQVYETLDDSQSNQTALSDLVGFRAAYALHVRDADATWYNEELREDFEHNVEQYGRWRAFLRDVSDALGRVGELGGLPERSEEAKLLHFTAHCFEAFRGLRGRSVAASIRYPRGDQLALTSYSLVGTLRGYDIDRVEDGTVLVVSPSDPDDLSVVTARLPGYESRPTQYSRSTRAIEDDLQTQIRRSIDTVERRGRLDASVELFQRFYDIVQITAVVVPATLTTPSYELQIEQDTTGPPELIPVERDI